MTAEEHLRGMEARLGIVETRASRLRLLIWGLAFYALAATAFLIYRGGFFGRPLFVDTVRTDRVEVKELVVMDKATATPKASVMVETGKHGDAAWLSIRFQGGELQMENFEGWTRLSSVKVGDAGARGRARSVATLEDVAKMISDAQRQLKMELHGIPR